jgi:hypothetical protein
MAIQLSDDGTLDTVLCCSDCGEEMRYNCDWFVDEDESENGYDEFIAWAIEDAANDHVCEQENQHGKATHR